MHDPTEGGVATGLHEMLDASGGGIVVSNDALWSLVLPETREICYALGVNPFGLLSSGSLLIAADSNYARTVLHRLAGMGIPANGIGRAHWRLRYMYSQDPNGGRDIQSDLPPRFEQDEVARVLEQQLSQIPLPFPHTKT